MVRKTFLGPSSCLTLRQEGTFYFEGCLQAYETLSNVQILKNRAATHLESSTNTPYWSTHSSTSSSDTCALSPLMVIVTVSPTLASTRVLRLRYLQEYTSMPLLFSTSHSKVWQAVNSESRTGSTNLYVILTVPALANLTLSWLSTSFTSLPRPSFHKLATSSFVKSLSILLPFTFWTWLLMFIG